MTIVTLSVAPRSSVRLTSKSQARCGGLFARKRQYLLVFNVSRESIAADQEDVTVIERAVDHFQLEIVNVPIARVTTLRRGHERASSAVNLPSASSSCTSV